MEGVCNPRAVSDPSRELPLRNLSDAELVAMQGHANDWYVRQARLHLQMRAVDGKLELIAGERRWRACEKLGLETVPVIEREADEVSAWYARRGAGYEMGTWYTVIAGLLNVLVIYDAYGGPLAVPISGRKRDDQDSSESKSDDEPSESSPKETATPT